MNKNKLIILIQLIGTVLYGQDRTLPIQIDVGYSTELLITFDQRNPHVDTIAVFEDRYSICSLKDSRGAMSIQTYTNNHVLIEEGQYINSIDTFKSCAVVEDPYNPGTQMVIVEKYFHPLKDGLWKYYNRKGKIIREEHWRKGILGQTILFGKLAKKQARIDRRARKKSAKYGITPG